MSKSFTVLTYVKNLTNVQRKLLLKIWYYVLHSTKKLLSLCQKARKRLAEKIEPDFFYCHSSSCFQKV